MPRIGSAKPFGERQNIIKAEKDLFLGTASQFKKFKRLMYKPIAIKDKQSRLTGKFGAPDCDKNKTKPLQIRVMGQMDEVRDITKKIMKLIKPRFPKGATIEDVKKKVGLTKLDCEFLVDVPGKTRKRKIRAGNYCANTIRSYINAGGTPSRECASERKGIGQKCNTVRECSSGLQCKRSTPGSQGKCNI